MFVGITLLVEFLKRADMSRFVSAITFLFSDILNSLPISFLLNVLKYLPYKNYLRAFDCQGKKKNWDIIFLKIPLVVDPIKRHDA